MVYVWLKICVIDYKYFTGNVNVIVIIYSLCIPIEH